MAETRGHGPLDPDARERERQRKRTPRLARRVAHAKLKPIAGRDEEDRDEHAVRANKGAPARARVCQAFTKKAKENATCKHFAEALPGATWLPRV